MKFSPLARETTDDPILKMKPLLEPGTYHFKVCLASNEVSKNGNNMLKLSLFVLDKSGVSHIICDYLLGSMPHKLRNFCETTNLLAQYERGELSPGDCMDKGGLVNIIIEKGKTKPDGTRYHNRNSVKSYVKKLEKVSNNTEDDAILF
jgi:hypothetical protein